MASSAAIRKAVEHGDVMAVARNLDAGVSIETKDVRAAPSPTGTSPISPAPRASLVGPCARPDSAHRRMRPGQRPSPPAREQASGDTILANAALNGHVNIVALLLQRGANANAANSDGGDTVLMWAAVSGDCELIQLLLRAGASVNAENKKGYRPLFRAVYKDNLDAVLLLLAAGADPHAETRTAPRKTALDQALENRNEYTAKALRAYVYQDPVEMERVRLMFPQAAANYITLPSAQSIALKARS